MANLTLAEFQARYPAFSTLGISDATQQVFVDDANEHLSESAWNTESCYKKGAAAYAAHHLILNQSLNQSMVDDGLEGSAGLAGSLTSAQAGPLMVTLGAEVQDRSLQDEFYGQTQPGQEFLSYKRECVTSQAIASC